MNDIFNTFAKYVDNNTIEIGIFPSTNNNTFNGMDIENNDDENSRYSFGNEKTIKKQVRAQSCDEFFNTHKQFFLVDSNHYNKQNSPQIQKVKEKNVDQTPHYRSHRSDLELVPNDLSHSPLNYSPPPIESTSKISNIVQRDSYGDSNDENSNTSTSDITPYKKNTSNKNKDKKRKNDSNEEEEKKLNKPKKQKKKH